MKRELWRNGLDVRSRKGNIDEYLPNQSSNASRAAVVKKM